MSAAPPEGLLFEGPLGRMRVEDVLQFVAQAGLRARVTFATADRVHGWPRAVDLVIDDGRLVGLGPRGAGMRLGDLAVARGAVPRRVVEAAAAGPGAARLGARLAAAGHLDPEAVDDLLWERHARVVWGLLAWDRGTFHVVALDAADDAGAVVVDPALPVAGLLLDGLQRAEAARFDEEPGSPAAESDPARS